MSKITARIFLALFTLVWGSWTAIELFASISGDCIHDQVCFAIKEYSSALLLWRGLAIELAAIFLYILIMRSRKS